ncbi:hypothetical protein CPAV1605_1506 [seawater metagenome]|uniref:Uncharacterized protein n=1 Tax=seawater metagenome TaxID=1561972 RepID=A0A5E8CMK5_9ZZZZ
MANENKNKLIQDKINEFSSFTKKDIDEYIKVGKQLINLSINQNLDKNTFSYYCRNYCNFLINHSDFNYLLEVQSNVNSEIIKNYSEYDGMIPRVIIINNILLELIKSEFQIDNYSQLKGHSWIHLDAYIDTLKNIKNRNNEILKFGDHRHMRIWVDIKVLEDRISKLSLNSLNTKSEIAFCDLLRFFDWISYRLLVLLKENNDIKFTKTVSFYVKKSSRNLKDLSRLNLINEAIGVYQNYLSKQKELKDILPKEETKIKVSNRTEIFEKKVIPTVLAVGTVLISGVIYKVL